MLCSPLNSVKGAAMSAVDLKVTAVLNSLRSSQLKRWFFCSPIGFLCGCGCSKDGKTGAPWKWSETSRSYRCLASLVARVSRRHSSLSLLQQCKMEGFLVFFFYILFALSSFKFILAVLTRKILITSWRSGARYLGEDRKVKHKYFMNLCN